MTSTRRRAAAAAVVATALALSACGGSSSSKSGSGTTAAGATTTAAAAKKKGGTLTVGIIDKPTSFAATDAELGNRVTYFQTAYDSLLHLSADGALGPWLATEWQYNADQTELTLKMKTGVKFTDGTPVNADAAAKNLNRLHASKGIGAPLTALMKEATAVDESTLKVTLTAPDPGFLTYLAGTVGMVESPAMFDKPDEKTNPVGSGPYILETAKTVDGSSYTYKANPDYWNKDIQHYDSIVLKVLSDATANANALKAGEIDAANVIQNDKVKELKDAGLNIQSQELDWVGLSFVDKDGKMNSALKDVKVRQAINYALDRDAFLKTNAQGLGTTTTQVFGKNSAAYDPALDTFYKYDPAKAKSLLAEAGVPNGFEFEMAVVPGLMDTAQALFNDQLGAVGIKVKWATTQISDYFGAILGPKYPAFYMFLEQNPNDWVALNFLASKTAIWNPAKYSDTTSDDLFAKIQKAAEADRPALYKQFGKHVVEDAWYAPVYRNQANYANNAKKVNVTIQSGNAVPFLWNYSPVG